MCVCADVCGDGYGHIFPHFLNRVFGALVLVLGLKDNSSSFPIDVTVVTLQVAPPAVATSVVRKQGLAQNNDYRGDGCETPAAVAA